MHHFIHQAGSNDGVGDCIFPEQCNSGGAAYAPYLFGVASAAGQVHLRYTLSTWNPHQCMLMRDDVALSALDALERPQGDARGSRRSSRTFGSTSGV